MSTNPVLGIALHLLQYLSNAALVNSSAYSNTLPVFKLALYKRSAIKRGATYLLNEAPPKHQRENGYIIMTYCRRESNASKLKG